MELIVPILVFLAVCLVIFLKWMFETSRLISRQTPDMAVIIKDFNNDALKIFSRITKPIIEAMKSLLNRLKD